MQADFDSAVYIYKIGVGGTSVNTQIKCALDDEETRQNCGKGATLNVDVEQGETYAIVVDGKALSDK